MSEIPASQRASALGRELASVREKNARLTRALATAREKLTELNIVLDSLADPPLTHVAVLAREGTRADVSNHGRRQRVSVASTAASIAAGDYGLINSDLVLVAQVPPPSTGETVGVKEILPDGRALVETSATGSIILTLTPRCHPVGAGDTLLADLQARVGLERVERADVEQMLTPEIPRVSYAEIGGLDHHIALIRDTVEMPFRHPDLYRSFGLTPSKGILLYGPPGCGKTLIARAIASSLGGVEGAYFLSVKGPELLSKFVGETERHIRALFARARELAAEDHPVVIFFDEMEALFRTRGAGISTDIETLVVPQLLAEIDGVEGLDNVIVIGASNREDMIDPAVLRPGRLDRRIAIERPTRDGARDIARIHLAASIPFSTRLLRHAATPAGARDHLVDHLIDVLWQTEPGNALVTVTWASGRQTTGYMRDLVSGAMIAGIIQRAKHHAIKDVLTHADDGLDTRHIDRALAQEIGESAALAGAYDPQQWGRTLGMRGERVTEVIPISRALD